MMRERQKRNKFAAVVAAAAIAFGAMGLAALPAGAAPIGNGSISGRVVDGNGTPLPNICVNDSGGGPTNTDPSGLYSLTGLATGTYFVQFSDCNPNPTYISQWYLGHADQSSADPVSVVDAADTPLLDVTMAAGATIQGIVTDTASNPLVNICVETAVPNGMGWYDWLPGNVSTDGNGAYTLSGLPATTLRVHFRDCNSGPYIEQWYSGQIDFNSAEQITLAGGDTRTGVDAQLGTGTAISGTVTDGSGNAIPNVNVSVNPTDNGSSAWAQTNPAGQYTTNALPPGTYTVQFQGTPSFAGEYWNDKLSRNDADVVTLTGSEGPTLGGIDAILTAGATVSGRVTGPIGQPLGNICVDATIQTTDGTDGIGGTTTDSNGNYTIAGVPATSVAVVFRDCNGVGPWVQEWWDNVSSREAATPIVLASGATRTGVDAQLAAAGAISGRVTDGSGDPIEGVCAQASTPTIVGGLAATDSNGDYSIVLAQPGSYHVQFVDCSGAAAFAGEWWDDATSAATAQAVPVVAGQTTGGIDASLAPGAPGSISGKVVNARGTAMTTACVIAYLPYQFVLFAAVQADGSYTIPNVPSGTYALAFLGCGSGGDPLPIVSDPDVLGVTYPASWWNGAPLSIDEGNEGGPDPIAQGANLVTVTPGANLTGYDACLGCTAITITSITPGPNSLTVAFTTLAVDTSGTGGASVTASIPITYTVSCSSPGGGASGSASGPGSPITVTGLTSGTSYICQVAAASGGTLLATSAVSSVLSAGAMAATPTSPNSPNAPTGASAAGGAGGSDPANAAGTTGSLPRTGATSTSTLVRAGFVLLLVGLVLAVTSRRRRRSPLSDLS